MSADQYPGGIREDDPAFDPTVSHQARCYNFFLGGKDHYQADRDFAEKVLAVYPDMGEVARANRAFLGRAVRFMAGQAGVGQFLDVGAGLPAPGNTHEVAQAVRPGSRVAYVDFDPVILAHSRAFLTGKEPGATAYIDADLRNPGVILEKASGTLDFTRPVGLLLIAVMHAIGDDEDPYGIVATLMNALPSGSYLAIAQWGKGPADGEREEQIAGLSQDMSRQQYTARTAGEIGRFFDGLDLAEPGLVPVQGWRPDPGDTPFTSTYLCLAGVAKKV